MPIGQVAILAVTCSLRIVTCGLYSRAAERDCPKRVWRDAGTPLQSGSSCKMGLLRPFRRLLRLQFEADRGFSDSL
jgi:hypothetical protein